MKKLMKNKKEKNFYNWYFRSLLFAKRWLWITWPLAFSNSDDSLPATRRMRLSQHSRAGPSKQPRVPFYWDCVLYTSTGIKKKKKGYKGESWHARCVWEENTKRASGDVRLRLREREGLLKIETLKTIPKRERESTWFGRERGVLA